MLPPAFLQGGVGVTLAHVPHVSLRLLLLLLLLLVVVVLATVVLLQV
jgi:hypothetical protein